MLRIGHAVVRAVVLHGVERATERLRHVTGQFPRRAARERGDAVANLRTEPALALDRAIRRIARSLPIVRLRVRGELGPLVGIDVVGFVSHARAELLRHPARGTILLADLPMLGLLQRIRDATRHQHAAPQHPKTTHIHLDLRAP